MELKDKFDSALNYLYNYKSLDNKVYDGILIEEDDDLQRFMGGEGEKAFYELLNDELSLNSLKQQVSFLKNDNSDIKEDLLYERGISVLLNNDTGFLNRNEYNILALTYFVGGVEKAIRTYYKIKYTTDI